MEIVQKKRSNKHTFTFKDDHFNFAYEDKSGSGDTDMSYADFPQKSSIQIEQNEWLRNVGYLWCALGVFQLGYALYSDVSLSGKGFWIMVGLVCVVWAHLSKVKYSVFSSERGHVFVIHDKNHQKIINELSVRRKSQLLDWYGEVNLENELEQEIKKFKWLEEQDVISKEESEKKIALAELLNKENFVLPGERLN
ncbi:hypothetical protein AB6C43_04975 [Vibrio splendidus]